MCRPGLVASFCLLGDSSFGILILDERVAGRRARLTMAACNLFLPEPLVPRVSVLGPCVLA